MQRNLEVAAAVVLHKKSRRSQLMQDMHDAPIWDTVAYNENGVLNHNHDKLNCLEQEKFSKPIIEFDIGVTPF